MAELSAADRALLQAAQDRARARMSGRTIDETGRDVVRLPKLLTIADSVATMSGSGGRQDATQQQGQDGRAAAATPPVGTIGSRDFYSCGGITEGGMGKAVQKFQTLVAADCGGLTGTNEDGKTVSIDPIAFGTIFQLVWPVLQSWLQKCRERRQQQDQTPQQHVAAIVANPAERNKAIQGMQTRILKVCEDGRKAERKRARQTGLPADVGRFSMDFDSAWRMADKTLTKAATMPAKDAAALCAECGVT